MKLKISVSQLSLGRQGDDVVRLHQALLALGRDIALAETDKRGLRVGSRVIMCLFAAGHYFERAS